MKKERFIREREEIKESMKEVKGVQPIKKELSNNILVLILIIIIFVAVLGTITVVDTMNADVKPKITQEYQGAGKTPSSSGMITLEIKHPDQKGE